MNIMTMNDYQTKYEFDTYYNNFIFYFIIIVIIENIFI